MSDKVSFVMCEYAWTDIDSTAKTYRKSIQEKNRIATVPLELWLIFSKHMLIADVYYWETKEGEMGK